MFGFRIADERIGTQDRPWNDPGPRRGQKHVEVEDNRPTLKAIVLDFSSTYNIDVTSVQGLIDVRNQLDRYTSPDILEWHFAGVRSRWTKRALAAAGFGYLHASQVDEATGAHRSIVSIADITSGPEPARNSNSNKPAALRDEENRDDVIYDNNNKGGAQAKATATATGRGTVYGVNRPFFHVDVSTAVANAVANAERKKGYASTEVSEAEPIKG
jgi:sodium-independent sulfate anion transporter 11